jgi:magnesium chelatase family protein
MPLPNAALIDRPPFRAPHHSASSIALVGGGSSAMRPGEISLAHNGVLFLDELGEFSASALDMLRQPLEEGVIRVSRLRFTISFPAHFLLVGAMNPCPCGEGGAPGSCRCSPAARARYARRLSGPLLDRFDLRVPVCRPDVTELLAPTATGEPSAAAAERVAGVRELARARGVATNAAIPGSRLDLLAPLSPGAARVLEHELRTGRLSARGLHRIRRVARTVADLDGAPSVVGEEHLCAALELRAEASVLEAVS